VRITVLLVSLGSLSAMVPDSASCQTTMTVLAGAYIGNYVGRTQVSSALGPTIITIRERSPSIPSLGITVRTAVGARLKGELAVTAARRYVDVIDSVPSSQLVVARTASGEIFGVSGRLLFTLTEAARPVQVLAGGGPALIHRAGSGYQALEGRTNLAGLVTLQAWWRKPHLEIGAGLDASLYPMRLKQSGIDPGSEFQVEVHPWVGIVAVRF
jgi:hypothetical protein